MHADFWLLLFCIIFSAALPEISIFKTLTLLVRTIQHKPLAETLRFLSAFSFEFYEFRLQKLFFSPFVVLFSIEAKKSFVAFLVVFFGKQEIETKSCCDVGKHETCPVLVVLKLLL